MPSTTTATLADGLTFPESPRWHDEKLWFSDMWAGRVMTLDGGGTTDVMAEFDDQPSGIGFLPDGTPIVALMRRRQIVRLDPTGPAVHADLTHLSTSFINDMVVGRDGVAYVGCSVFRRLGETGSEFIARVSLDGVVTIATENVVAPNGMVISADARQLICASPPNRSLFQFSIEANGNLVDRKLFAELEARPDGICLDAAGAVWIGGMEANACFRISPSGAVLQSVVVADTRWATACALGGDDRRTLFIATVHVTQSQIEHHLHSMKSNENGFVDNSKDRPRGFIEAVEVEVPGAGWP